MSSNTPMNQGQMKVVGGWALLVLIGILSMTWFQPKMLGNERERYSNLVLRLERAEDGAAEIRMLAHELSTIKGDATSIKHVPNDSQFAVLIQDLGARLEALGIEQREITNGGSVDLGAAMSIPMRVRMTSGFPGVYQTVRWIESLPRLIRVQRVQIKSQDLDDPWDTDLEVEITLDAVFDPDAKPGAVAGVDPEAKR